MFYKYYHTYKIKVILKIINIYYKKMNLKFYQLHLLLSLQSKVLPYEIIWVFKTFKYYLE